jgi:hypothetical protein
MLNYNLLLPYQTTCSQLFTRLFYHKKFKYQNKLKLQKNLHLIFSLLQTSQLIKLIIMIDALTHPQFWGRKEEGNRGLFASLMILTGGAFIPRPSKRGSVHKQKSPGAFAPTLLTCSGGRIRTSDLWVMSPTSYHCSTPQYILKQ